ncbi:hypothetical protein CDD81_7099 [Ophiocordyceps australis]|uniref:Uncharacterized protein n=1 Tax=Ophiocordyceps australis TaxID=1399860 RepID=A0A2C5Y5D8_9HYPO|nr:hypothetical protein CDD81_7099 [Ophiocordyceps australis]
MSSALNRYWIPHHEIHRRVITQELQYYLGPEATVRPYTLEGEDGFLISTPGACLTDEQIDDICHKSKEVWDRKAAAIKQENPAKALKRPLHQPIVISRSSSATKSRGAHRRHHNLRRRLPKE